MLFGILLIGLLGRTRSDSNPVLVAAPAVAPPGTIQPQTAKPQTAVPVSAEVQARISRMEEAVLAEPKNHTAWFALGNEYFDSHQHQKAVDAYAKGLALHPDDPNVLTDQGVMYWELGQFDKALANFQKANKLDPNHLQSLFNIGVLYHTNLNKPEEAAKAWKQVVTLAPNSEQASQARQMLNQLKK